MLPLLFAYRHLTDSGSFVHRAHIWVVVNGPYFLQWWPVNRSQ